jgi:hypothetical protein
MTENSGAPKSPANQAPQQTDAPAPDKKQVLRSRIAALEARVTELEKIEKALNPELFTRIKTANEDFLKANTRLTEWIQTLTGLLEKPLREGDASRNLRALREAAAQFFTQTKVNPDLWKNLGS